MCLSSVQPPSVKKKFSIAFVIIYGPYYRVVNPGKNFCTFHQFYQLQKNVKKLSFFKGLKRLEIAIRKASEKGKQQLLQILFLSNNLLITCRSNNICSKGVRLRTWIPCYSKN